MRPAQGSRNGPEAVPRLQLAPTVLDWPDIHQGDESISGELALSIFRIMLKARLLEERCIKMAKSGEAFFWVGGPGEEAFNTCLGMQIRKGQGPDYDYLHLHYRSVAVLMAMGMPIHDHIRQIAMRLTDPHSMGRNFVGHYAKAEWNLVPVTSVIATQFVMGVGTALVQKRHGSQAITVVTAGEAGTAEGDFASGLLWSNRPGHEVPMLTIITNNGYGISTTENTQFATSVVARARGFGIPGETVDGNDPIASWYALERAFDYVRRQQKPYLLEAKLSRLHGHSSSSGAQRVTTEADCVSLFERKLLDAGILDGSSIETLRNEAIEEIQNAVEDVLQEANPSADHVMQFTYAPSEVDAVYPNDYTGLPQ